MTKKQISFLPLFSLGALIFLVLVIGYWIFGKTPTLAIFGILTTVLSIVAILPSRFERIEKIIDTHVSSEVHYTFIWLAVILILFILFYLKVNYTLSINLQKKTNE